jgi:hypothetical protein
LVSVERPDTRYVRSGDVHIAYQLFGEGPAVFVWVPGQLSNVELLWDEPDRAAFRVLRLSSSPASFALAYRTWFDIDVRHILGSIQAPTLVIHDAVGDIDEARYVVERIPLATLAALPRNEGAGGCDLVDGKLSGIAVAVGARVAAQAAEGEVLVSGTVRDLVAGSEIEFDSRGMRELKGLGEWPLYAVSGI